MVEACVASLLITSSKKGPPVAIKKYILILHFIVNVRCILPGKTPFVISAEPAWALKIVPEYKSVLLPGTPTYEDPPVASVPPRNEIVYKILLNTI